MYRNLEAEIARIGMTKSKLAEILGITPTTVSLKLNGKSNLSLKECVEIKRIIGCDFPVEKLFESSADKEKEVSE